MFADFGSRGRKCCEVGRCFQQKLGNVRRGGEGWGGEWGVGTKKLKQRK